MMEFLPAIIIGLLVMSGSSIVAIVLFWMRIGGKLENADKAVADVKTALSKSETAMLAISDLKAEVAKEYAPIKTVHEMESKLIVMMNGMTDRLDKIFIALMGKDEK